MKLRNRKTGEIQEIVVMPVIGGYPDEHEIVDGGTSLEEFNKIWVDYKEPLIKDEKIRKVVRAWAEVCNLKHVTYKQSSNEFYDADTRGAFAIRFMLIPVEVYLEDGEHYTIADLCGEEEKNERKHLN